MSHPLVDTGRINHTQMKTNLLNLRTPTVELCSALAQNGLRSREDYDELIHDSDLGHARLSLRRHEPGQLVRCFLSVEEERLLARGLELFHELAGEGHPVVAYGIGRGQTTFEFEWLHPDGTDWRISAERVQLLMQRLDCALGPKLAPLRRRQARRCPIAAELLEGVLARAVTAA